MKNKKFSCIIICFFAVVFAFAQNTRKFELLTEEPSPAETIYTPTGNPPRVVVQEGHNDGINFVKYSMNGQYLLSVGNDMKVWDVSTGKIIRSFYGFIDGKEVSVLHPKDVIRFKVSVDKSSYLAILCIDAHKEETWLPLQNNFIRAGESRIFPDIPGAVLRVEDGIFGNESVKVYAATVEADLPNQKKMMGTRGFVLANENAETAEAVVNYRVVK